MSALFGRGGNSSTHQFGCSGEDMGIHGLDFGFPKWFMVKPMIRQSDRHHSYEIKVAVDRWGSGMLGATISLGAVML